MADWTKSALAELERYSERVAASLEGSGADPAEVIDDLKRHVEADVSSANLKVVTEEDVRRILTRIGVPGSPFQEGFPKSDDTKAVWTKGKKYRGPGRTVLIFGVILPVATIITELITRMCASDLFDPMPSIWHELLVAFVPLSNLAAWIVARKQKSEWRRFVGVANGFAVGICLYYSLLFLPLAPFSVIGIIYFGLGLLPLTPIIALAAALKLLSDLGKMPIKRGDNRESGKWWGLAGAAVILVVIALPAPLTRHFEQMAVSDSPASAAQGIRWLRAIGSKATLLRDCYGEREFDLWTKGSINGLPVHPDLARTIFFRVTGQPFNSISPKAFGYHSDYRGIYDEWSWDSGLGGETVQGQLKGLSLNSSRLDCKIAPNEAFAYSEWTLEFKNDAFVQREARAQILLPAGGVVSRLTLWVNGEEREAAFSGRSQVRAAYQEVAIQQRHDPVLVTTCGPDRVLMQCFPVPPNGGTMKVRIGITAPLAIENLQSGRVRLPVLLERNFDVGEKLKHSVWIESREPMKAGWQKLKAEQPKAGQYVLRGDLADSELGNSAVSVSVQRKDGSNEVWASQEGNAQLVHQKIIEKHEPAPARVIVMVDGSVGVAEFVPAIAAALHNLPDGVDFAMLLASDTNIMISGPVQKGSRAAYDAAAKKLESASFAGGQDNVPALAQAWDLAAETNNAVVLWIHGPQPVILEGVDGLKQRFERSPDGPRLLELQTKIGPNRVAEQLDGLGAVVSVSRFDQLEEDLDRLFNSWSGKTPVFSLKRDLVNANTSKSAMADSRAGAHVVRLWASEEVVRLAAQRHLIEAAQLACRSQIVTPYSGAVVLETAVQFAQAGLTPADPEKVPTMGSVPDKNQTFWLLVLTVALLFGLSFCHRRVKSQ